MTRAFLNLMYKNKKEEKRGLSHYHSGDQYPIGLKRHYNLFSFLDEGIKQKGLTPEMFKNWVKKEYKRVARPLKVGEKPMIYETENNMTDYSYVFEAENVLAYSWDKLVFDGNLKKFKAWVNKIERREALGIYDKLPSVNN